MKTFKHIFLLAIIAAFVGCSSDDDSGKTKYDEENIIGLYDLDKFESKEKKTTQVDGFDVTTTTTKKGETFDYTYEFTEEGNLILNGTYTVKRKKKQGDNIQDTTYYETANNDTLLYSVNTDDKKLTIDGKTYKVKKFNDVEMKLKREKEEESQDLEYTEDIHLEKM